MMFFAGFLVTFLLVRAATESTSDNEIPFVISPPAGSSDGKPTNLLPDFPEEPPLTGFQLSGEGAPSDVAPEQNQQFRGYFYPKPSQPFYLPPFKTLDAPVDANLQRSARSPRRWPQHFQPPPPFIPGFIPPHQIRPLPALYGRPGGY